MDKEKLVACQRRVEIELVTPYPTSLSLSFSLSLSLSLSLSVLLSLQIGLRGGEWKRILLEEHFHEAAGTSYSDAQASGFEVLPDDVVIKTFLDYSDYRENIPINSLPVCKSTLIFNSIIIIILSILNFIYHFVSVVFRVESAQHSGLGEGTLSHVSQPTD